MTITSFIKSLESSAEHEFKHIEGAFIKKVDPVVDKVKDVSKHTFKDAQSVISLISKDTGKIVNKLESGEQGFEKLLSSTSHTIQNIEGAVGSTANELPYLFPLILVGGYFLLSNRR
jgi:hypothetical protein